MFGNLDAFVNGTMFAGPFGSSPGVKLADDRAELATIEGTGPFGPAEKATFWVNKAQAYVVTLPPKPEKGNQ